MKKTKLLLLAILSTTFLTGCFKRDNMDNITIYTTTYPLHYLVEQIYGYNSEVKSVYPAGVEVDSYELTTKQKKDYAEGDMFVYNTLNGEKNIAASLLEYNQNMKFIPATKNFSEGTDIEALWLSPANYLMVAQNIKNELLEFTNSTVLQQEIEDKYDSIKLTISKYDAELKLIAENAQCKTIVAGNDVFEFLEHYGFEVLSVEDNDKFLQSDYQTAKNNINNKSNQYIFILDTDSISENVKKLQAEGAKVITVKSMINLSEEQIANNEDYPKMMLEFIDQIKMEAYN